MRLFIVSLILFITILLGIFTCKSANYMEGVTNPNKYDDMYALIKPTFDKECEGLDTYIKSVTPTAISERNDALYIDLELFITSNIYNSLDVNSKEFKCVEKTFEFITYKNSGLLSKIIDKMIKFLTDIKPKLFNSPPE